MRLTQLLSGQSPCSIHTVTMKTVFMVICFHFGYRCHGAFNFLIFLENTGLSWSSREPWLFASLSYDGRVRYYFIVIVFLRESSNTAVVVSCILKYADSLLLTTKKCSLRPRSGKMDGLGYWSKRVHFKGVTCSWVEHGGSG